MVRPRCPRTASAHTVTLASRVLPRWCALAAHQDAGDAPGPHITGVTWVPAAAVCADAAFPVPAYGVSAHRHARGAPQDRVGAAGVRSWWPQRGGRPPWAHTGARRQALRMPAADCRPSSSTDASRISTLRTLPVTVIGKASTTFT